MKVLVYGAGVIGCTLAHTLARGHAHVTLLARGDWKDRIDSRGLIIRHPAQLHTTVDRITTVDHLEPHWAFDLIFVTMQADQRRDVLEALAENHSRYVIYVGNDFCAEQTEDLLYREAQVGKEAAFAFFSAGGRRENGRVISLHAGLRLTIGGSAGPLSEGFCKRLQKASAATPMRLCWQEDMGTWLKCHLALILPLWYYCCAREGDLRGADRAVRQTMLDAAVEFCGLLRAMGCHEKTVQEEADWYTGFRLSTMKAMLLVLVKTELGRLCVSDHAMHAVSELRRLDRDVEAARAQFRLPMPAWDKLRMAAAAPAVLHMGPAAVRAERQRISP